MIWVVVIPIAVVVLIVAFLSGAFFATYRLVDHAAGALAIEQGCRALHVDPFSGLRQVLVVRRETTRLIWHGFGCTAPGATELVDWRKDAP